jgi:hypothetical protein
MNLSQMLVKATLSHLDMLDLRNSIEQSESTTIYIENRRIRAQCSGLLHDNGCIGRYQKGTLLATITDPFERLNEK